QLQRAADVRHLAREPLQLGDRVLELSLARVEARKRHARRPALGLRAHRALEVGARRLHLAALESQRAEPQQRIDVLGAQPQPGVERLLGAGNLSPLEEEVAKACVSVGELWKI